MPNKVAYLGAPVIYVERDKDQNNIFKAAIISSVYTENVVDLHVFDRQPEQYTPVKWVGRVHYDPTNLHPGTWHFPPVHPIDRPRGLSGHD
jgi:hypothetical protein